MSQWYNPSAQEQLHPRGTANCAPRLAGILDVQTAFLETGMAKYEINFEEIRQTAVVSFRRAQVFVGLCHNSALSDDVSNWTIPDAASIRFVPMGPDPEDITKWLSESDASETELTERLLAHKEDPNRLRQYKRAWLHWAIYNSFTEIIESFELFLTQAFHALTMFKCANDGVLQTEQVPKIEKATQAFSRKGLRQQVKALTTSHGLALPETDLSALCSLSIARNCITHARGIVRSSDTNEEGFLIISWHPRVGLLRNSDGSTVELEKGLRISEGKTLEVGVVPRERSFPAGYPIWLSSQDLMEMCEFSFRCVEVVMQHLRKIAKESGVPGDYDSHEESDAEPSS